MANNTLQLALKIRADMDQAIQQLVSMDDSLDGLKDSAERTSPALDGVAGSVRSLVGAWLSWQALSRAVSMADEYGFMAERIKQATDSAAEYNLVQERLIVTANDTYRSLSEAQETYVQASIGLKNLGYETTETLDIVDSLSYAFVRNATSSDKANAAMNALVRATNRGTVLTEHWASLLIAVPTLLDNIADSSGKSAIEISELGYSGQLSAKLLTEGLRLSLDENKRLAGEMATTVEDAVTRLTNALSVFLGEANSITPATQVLVVAIEAIADNLDLVSLGLGTVAAVMASRYVSALTLATAAQLRTATSARVLSAALATLGGPIGLATLAAITAITVAITAQHRQAQATADLLARLQQQTAQYQAEQNTESALKARIDAEEQAIQRLIASVAKSEQVLQQWRSMMDSGAVKGDALTALAENYRKLEASLAGTDERIATHRRVIADLRESLRQLGVVVDDTAGRTDEQQKGIDRINQQLMNQLIQLRTGAAGWQAYQLAIQGATQAEIDQAEALRSSIEQITDGDLVTRAQVQLYRSQGNQVAAAGVELERQYGELMERLRQRGDTEGLAVVEGLVQVETAKARLEQLQAEVDRVFTEQERREQSIQSQREAGLITEYRAREQIRDLHQETAEEVAKLVPEMQALADATGDPQAVQNLEDMQQRLAELQQQASELKKAFEDGLTGGIETALVGLARGTMDLREATLAMVNSVLDALARMAAQQLALKAVDGLMGGGDESAAADKQLAAATTLAAAGTTVTAGATATTAAATALTTAGGTVSASAAAISASAIQLQQAAVAMAAANATGSAMAFATGGHVLGPGTGTSDSIPAWLSNNEFVTRAAVVSQPGALSFLHDFNARGMDALTDWSRAVRHATGGLAGVPAPQLPSPVVPATEISGPGQGGNTTLKNAVHLHLAQDPESIAAAAWSKPGQDHFMVFLQQNGATVRQLIGG